MSRVDILYVGARPAAFLECCKQDPLAVGQPRAFSQLRDLASISDQSDGRVIIRVGGARAREALAKGVPVDLHPDAFRPGDAAVTTVAYIGVALWQVDDAPTYEFSVPRSYVTAFHEWLTAAAAEFGVRVADEGGSA